ncbi:MAG: RHS repeat-associated core domain-containing protein, partial [Holophagales bacterium]|nr:RHS repeat-associated core domain-containing protein [Holophagales bacterium]
YGWDNRGLLVFERHPEVGTSSGLGTVTFRPDVLGNPRLTSDGLHSLTHEYDGDGRLIRIKQGSKVWKEQFWANSNSGSDYRKGKLIKAVRHNYPGGGTFSWAFAETYEYRGKLGKMSKRVTQLQWPMLSGNDRFAHTFSQTWTYDVLGDLVAQTYPTCITTPENGRRYCNDPSDSQAPAHTVSRVNNQRLPVRVSSSLGISADYRYHWNYQTKRIDYSNNTYSIFGQGTNGMQRPHSITHYRPSGSPLFASGTYHFDDAGNIWAIGNDRFVYDRAGRLTRGTARSPARFELYTYDAADNVRSVARDGGGAGMFAIDGKNRMRGFVGGPSDITYDGAGNLIGAGPTEVDYDVFNMEVRFFQGVVPTREYLYGYTPTNHRILTLDVDASTFHWSLRDFDGKILREHRATGSGHYVSPSQPGEIFTFEKDHVHGPNGLIATRDAAGVERFFHQDHLGSTRVISDAFGSSVGTQDYYPYGSRANVSGDDERTATFTGHELDRHGLSYYILARNFVPSWVRFGSVDPLRASWNLYGYASSNPLGRTDPTGLADHPVEVEEIDFMFGFAITDGVQARFKVNTIIGDELPDGNFEAEREFSFGLGFVGSFEINFAKDMVVSPVQIFGKGAGRITLENKSDLQLNELRFGLLGISLDAMSSGPGKAGFDSFLDSAETSFVFAPLAEGFDFVVPLPLSGVKDGLVEASRRGNAMRLERLRNGTPTRSDFQ